MSKRIEAADIWKEYQRGVDYNTGICLYDQVKRNERFYTGRQWEGLKAPDLEKPVLNILKRVVTYFIAMIVSDDVGVSINSFNPSLETNIADNVLSSEVERVLERTGAKPLFREAIRDAAVDGDACFFFRFDPDIKTGQAAEGEIVIETVDNTNIIFGNPYDRDLQAQPYLILVQRRYCRTVKEEARKAGVKDWELIRPDNEPAYYDNDRETAADDLVTVVTKLWRDGTSGTVQFARTTKDVVLQQTTDTGYKRYPISYMSWEKLKNNYHGQAALTDGVIENQIFVNTMWALLMIHAKSNAFPKIFYDVTKIDRWTNRVGQAIEVAGNPNDSVAMNFRPADFSNQILEVVKQTIEYTKECMGASDAALGNVRPDNTSAIIAVQKASAAPLELQRLSYYQFVEDSVRCIIDIICTDYGLRMANFADADGNDISTMFDFSAIDTDTQELNIEVGSSAYWSEMMQMQTADNLFQSGIITDAVDYLNSIPDKYIKGKAKIIQKLEEKQRLAQMQMPQGAPSAAGPIPQEMQAQLPEIPPQLPPM